MPVLTYQTVVVALDGTNDGFVDFAGQKPVSISIIPDTTTIAVEHRLSEQSDWFVARSGRPITYELNLAPIDAKKLSLFAASAVTVFVIVGYYS